MVEASAERCSSCGVVFDEEVKAFSCPRCKAILALGTPECEGCGMQFKVKALKQSGDDTEVETSDEALESDTGEERTDLADLLNAANEFIAEKSAVLSRMVNRRAEEKKMLAKMEKTGITDVTNEMVEAEVLSLAEDMEDIARLHSDVTEMSSKVLAVVGSMGLGAETRAKAESMRAAGTVSLDVAGGADALAAKEEELARREEMVDRKIKGYASKKKELQDQEAAIADKLKLLEERRVELKDTPSGADDDAEDRLRQREVDIAGRLSLLQTVISGYLGETSRRECSTVDEGISALEASMKEILDRIPSLEKRLDETRLHEDEIKDLLKALDSLLEHLPETVIQEFTDSDAYKLYEKVLERYGI